MSEDNKIRLPSGQGGLTRFSEESTSKIQISPTAVIVICVLVIIGIALLHQFGAGLIK